MKVVPYTPEDAQRWDAFIPDCPMSCFLHSRRFLSYHGERFVDCSVMFMEGETLLGVLPAAARESAAESHPGATFGGIVHDGYLSGNKMTEAVTLAAEHYRREGFSSFVCKPPPACWRRRPCDDDIYALYKLGANVSACKLSCVISLQDRAAVTHARRKGRKKAARAGLQVACGEEHMQAVWALTEKNLRERHNAAPVHSFAEIKLLAQLFPDNIQFHAGFVGEDIVCGGVLFLSPSVWHAQYVHSNDAGREIYALDYFYEHLASLATAAGMRHFSFGASDHPDGSGLNDGLHAFKRQFGGGGEAHFAFSLPL